MRIWQVSSLARTALNCRRRTRYELSELNSRKKVFSLGMRQTFAAALLVILGGTVACGGGNSTASTSPLTVAELFAVTGRGSIYGEYYRQSAHVAVLEVNSHGGVMGHPLTEIAQDTASDPVDAVTAWHNLAIQNPAFMLGPSSIEILGVIKLYDPAHMVDFPEGGSTALDHMQYQYVWRNSASDTSITAAMAYYANQKSYKRAAMFFQATTDGTDELTAVSQFYTAHGGAIVDTERLAVSQTSYRTEVAKAFAANPDVVMVSGLQPMASTLFSNMKELGHLNVPVIADDNGADPKWAGTMGFANANKWLVGIFSSPPQGEAWQNFVAGFKKTWGVSQPPPTMDTYDSVMIASLAMIDAKSIDSKVWVNKILEVSNPPGTMCYTFQTCVQLLNQGNKINYEGAGGPDDFNKYHNVSVDWGVGQWSADGNSSNVVMTVPAAAINQYLAGG
jgi:ABC-type branched-subunit amino acid transport system substrate-binding protein